VGPVTVGGSGSTRRLALWVAAICAAVLVVAGCTTATPGTGVRAPSAGTPGASGAAGQQISFSDCSHVLNVPSSGRYKDLTVSCGKLQVPLDYAQPTGTSITLQLLKVHSKKQSSPTGSLLVNPGGPGGSGIVLAVDLAGSIDSGVLDHFDLIGFDPRGVGLSSPVTCFSDAQKDADLAAAPDVRTTAGIAAAQAMWAQVAQSCTAKYGSALQHYNTVETAQDMERIRQAVGDPAMNYLGFSYGTELGAVYAHLYPKTIRTAVLDGAVDPANAANPVAATEEQLSGFEEAFGQFAAYCVTKDPCKQLGDPKQAVLSLEAATLTKPLPSGSAGDRRQVTEGIVELAAAEAMYDESLWDRLAKAMITARGGDGSGLLALADQYADRDSSGHYDNLLDVFQVVSCNDSPKAADPTDDQVVAAATRWATQYPIFWRGQAGSLVSCRSWQPDRHPIPTEDAPGSKPILVVGNLNDPATPYVGAQHLAQTLGNATLLTLDGQGHTSYLDSPCISGKVNSYLITGTVPAANTKCSK
jgi:pimeloyl-ACP methyl ester carboxylesterase